MSRDTLTKTVEDLMKEVDENKLGDLVEDAAKLAELFKDIEPEPYIIPHGALIGVGKPNKEELRSEPERAAAWWQVA